MRWLITIDNEYINLNSITRFYFSMNRKKYDIYAVTSDGKFHIIKEDLESIEEAHRFMLTITETEEKGIII
jgi:hypothetical protein